MTFHYTLALAPDGADFRGFVRDLVVYEETSPPRVAPVPPDLAPLLSPTFRVSRQGAFGGIVGVPALQQSMRRHYEALASRGRLSGDAARKEQLLAWLTSAEVLEVTVRDTWDPVIGHWVGVEVVPGRTYTSSRTIQIPGMEGVDIPTTARLTASELACTRAQIARRCLRLETVQVPDPKAFRSAIEQLRKRSGDNAGWNDSEAARLEIKTVTVLEPEGMIPHRFVAERVLFLGSANVESRQLDQRSFEFVAAPRPPPTLR